MSTPNLRSLRMALLLCGLAAQPSAAESPFDPESHSWLPPHSRLGLHVQSMTPELREFMKAPTDRGVLVVRVDPDRAAAGAGVRVGDVIVAAEDEPVAQPLALRRRVARVPEGGKLTLHLLRAGETHALQVAPEGRPSAWADPEGIGEWLGEHMRRGGGELRERLEQLEQRLEELERRLGAPSPNPLGQT